LRCFYYINISIFAAYKNSKKMNTSLLAMDKDPMGKAISDYHQGKATDTLRVFSSQFDEDEIPIAHLFRTFEEMSPIEQRALQEAKGKVLDVGGGAGCHALVLQENKLDVTAIDLSALSVETMKSRGVKKCKQIDFFDPQLEGPFDTILLLMNGAGIIGEVNRFEAFFAQVDRLLAAGGALYMDSSDLRYLYEEEDHSFSINLADKYYGEIDFKMSYRDIVGETFNWLYIDIETLTYYSKRYGYQLTLLTEGKHFDYLVKLDRSSASESVK